MRSCSRKPRDDINALELYKASCDGARWREKRRMWLFRVQSATHQPAGLTLQHTALPSTSFSSYFSLSVFHFLPKYQPTIHSSPLVLYYLTPSIFSLLTQTNMLIFHCPTVTRSTKEPSIPPFSIHLPSNTAFKLVSLHLSAHRRNDPPFICFLSFFFLRPLLSLFSLFHSQCIPNAS